MRVFRRIRDGRRHFEVEEALILPALPPGDTEWDDATTRVRVDHADIAARARALDPGDVDPARELGEAVASAG